MGALLALLLLEATEEIVMLVLLATVAALGPQLGVQLGENPRFSLAATAAATAAGAWTCIWGLRGCDWWTDLADSDPQAVAKAVLSKPLFSCAPRFDVVIGELKFVGEGPKTEPVFMIGDGSTTAGCVAKGDEPKMEAPVDWPVNFEYCLGLQFLEVEN